MLKIDEYRWPDLSPVIRQYIVQDDQGRYGIASIDPVYRGVEVLFARPIDTPAEIQSGKAIYMTPTAWNAEPDGTYTGTWHDYNGPSHVTGEYLRHLTIIQDLGYLMPDWAAEKLLAEQPSNEYMTAAQAEDFASEVGEQATARGIRLAAKNGYIPGAKKNGRDWLIPYEGFDHYLNNRPKPGRK